MSWEYKHIYSESNTSHNFKVDFYAPRGWQVQSHATGPEGKYTIMERLNPKAVDHVFNDGCLFLESAERVPVSEESRRKAIQIIARRWIKFRGWTIHRVCQEIAIEAGYSYECIREILDDQSG